MAFLLALLAEMWNYALDGL